MLNHRLKILIVSVLGFALLPGSIGARAGQTGAGGADDPRARALLNAIETGSEDERAAAMFQLANLHLPVEQGLPVFAAHLVRKTGTLSEALEIAHAVDGLAAYGTQAKPALPALVRLADDAASTEAMQGSARQIWWPVTNALAKIGPGDAGATRALIRAVRRGMENPAVYAALATDAAGALADAGPADQQAAAALTAAVNRCDASNAWVMARALASVTRGSSAAVRTIVQAIDKGTTPDLMAAVLGEIGPPAHAALPTLTGLLRSDHLPVCMAAYAAIAAIAPSPDPDVQQALSVLRSIDGRPASDTFSAFRALRSPDARSAAAAELLAQLVQTRSEIYLRRAGIEALAIIGPNGDAKAARLLCAACSSADPILALKPADALSGFGRSDGAAAAGSLIPLLADQSAADAAAAALVRMGPGGSPAVPTLIKLLRGVVPGERLTAADQMHIEALGQIGAAASEASGVLGDILLQVSRNKLYAGSTSGQVVLASILLALTRTGVPQDVMPALQQALHEGDAAVFAAAARAAGMLGPRAAALVPDLRRALEPGFHDAALTANLQYGYVAETTARLEAVKALASIAPPAVK